MKNLLQHSSEEIQTAIVRLLDALSQYERSTGRNYLVIVKVDHLLGVHGYRSLSGGPASERDSDEALLEAFSNIVPPEIGR